MASTTKKAPRKKTATAKAPKVKTPSGKISTIIRSLPSKFDTPKIKVEELKHVLVGRSYGLFLLILALPNLVPIPAPGLSAVLGVPLLLFTFQLMLGLKSPWFPQFIANRTIKASSLARICERSAPYIVKLERVIKPRMQFLVEPPVSYLIALVCVFMSLMIMMPIPFGNALPALAICLFAVGILQRDGLFIIFGAGVAVASATLISAVLSGAISTVSGWMGF